MEQALKFFHKVQRAANRAALVFLGKSDKILSMSEENISKNEEGNEEEIIVEDENLSVDLNLKKLREKLKKCMIEKDEYLAGWQRAKADFINARNEEKEKRVELLKFANVEIIAEILLVLDSFDLAMKSDNWQKLDKNWQEGIKLLYNQLSESLKKHNLVEIQAVGNAFNPEDHESVGELETINKKEDGLVLEEIRKGYKLEGKTIRPAHVKVGKYKNN